MKFAKNRLYIERYTKCPNCGILIFENSESNMKQTIFVGGPGLRGRQRQRAARQGEYRCFRFHLSLPL